MRLAPFLGRQGWQGGLALTDLTGGLSSGRACVAVQREHPLLFCFRSRAEGRSGPFAPGTALWAAS